MMKLNDFHLKAMLFGLERAKTEYRIAKAAMKTTKEIIEMWSCGLLTTSEYNSLICEMWGDSDG